MKAWIALVLSAALIVLGALPVLYFVALFAWQLATSMRLGAWVPLPTLMLFTDPSLLLAGKAAPILGFLPDLSWAWRAGADTPPPLTWALSKTHLAVLPALAGLFVAGCGVLRLMRQRAALRVRRQQREDRLRRAQDYQRAAPADALGRREPFIA